MRRLVCGTICRPFAVGEQEAVLLRPAFVSSKSHAGLHADLFVCLSGLRPFFFKPYLLLALCSMDCARTCVQFCHAQISHEIQSNLLMQICFASERASEASERCERAMRARERTCDERASEASERASERSERRVSERASE